MLNQRGFTLIELIAVMLILGVIVTIAATKFINLDRSAADRVVDLAIEELNVREKLTWSNCRLEDRWADIAVCTSDNMIYDLGKGHVSADRTSITVNGVSVPVSRADATPETPAIWERTDV